MYNEQGYYIIWLYEGRFKPVLIDDRLPCWQGQPQNFFDERNLGLVLLEKACAKLLGSYAALAKASTARLFEALTGAAMIECEGSRVLKRLASGLHPLERLVMGIEEDCRYVRDSREVLTQRHDKERLLLVESVQARKGHWYREQHFHQHFRQYCLACHSPSLFLAWSEFQSQGAQHSHSWYIRCQEPGSALFKIGRARAP